jgi:MFS family permease
VYPSLADDGRRSTPSATPTENGPAGTAPSSNVVRLGLTSMFSDISSEMVTSILPLLLTFQLRFSALQFGLVDGLNQGTTALVRVASGVVADRWQRHKEVAAVGYATSAACRLGLIAAGPSWAAVTGVQVLDRTGKGVRTAPRDALISLSSPPGRLGRSFGVHRAFDTAGALLGPLVAFAVLQAAPADFDTVLVVSFCFAVVGLGILTLLVERPRVTPADTPAGTATFRRAFALLRQPRFRSIVVAGSFLSAVTISDSFVYLLLREQTVLTIGFFPLLFSGTAVSYLFLAVPAGRLADRFGRGEVFLAGHLALLGVYAVLLRAGSGRVGIAVCLVLLGAYYAASDGVLMALASAQVPAPLRTSGLALVTTATALARLLSSVAFGLAWLRMGPTRAVGGFAIGMIAVLLVVGPQLLRGHRGDR